MCEELVKKYPRLTKNEKVDLDISRFNDVKVRELIPRLQQLIEEYGEEVEINYDYRWEDLAVTATYRIWTEPQEAWERRVNFSERMANNKAARQKTERHTLYLKLKKEFENE